MLMVVKGFLKRSGKIVLATVLIGSSLIAFSPVSAFADEAVANRVALTAIPADATEVATFGELRAALLDANVTNIKLTADIRVTSSFNFSSQKNLYGDGHTIDMNNYRIGISKTKLLNRVEGITITNQNIYPLFWSESSEVTVTYKDVNSSGAQFIYNAHGTTILEGKITANSTREEVYQGDKLLVKSGATVNFTSQTSSPALRVYDSVNQEANSDFKVTSKDISLYGHDSDTKIIVAGSMVLKSTDEQAIYTAWSNAEMTVVTGGKFQATSGELTEEGISLTNGNLTVQTGADFVVTSPGRQGTVQTSGKLVFENGSNFLITNTNAVGSVFANYSRSSTNININSDNGLSTWDAGLINSAKPTHNYYDFKTATFDLSGWDRSNLNQKNLTSNSSDFKAQFVSKTTAKISGGSYALTNIAATTIDRLTTDSTNISGTAEPNATIEIRVNGEVIGTGNSDSEGKYNLVIPRQVIGTEVTVEAVAKGKTSSASTNVQQGRVLAETTIDDVTNKSTVVSGTAEPNATIEAKVGAEVIATGTVNADGQYSLTIPAQKVGVVVTVNAMVDWLTSSASTTVTKETEGTITITDPFYIGYDEAIKSTVSGDVAKVYLQVDGTDYKAISAEGSFEYLVEHEITSLSQEVYLVAVDESGKELSRAKVELKDGDLLRGSVSADAFIVGVSNYVAGTYEGSIAKVALVVNGTVYPAVGVVGEDTFQYYAKDKITSLTDNVEVLGYNPEGKLIYRTAVLINGPGSIQGTITEDSSDYIMITDSYIRGTFTGGVKYISLVVNNMEYAKVGVIDSINWQYYAKDKITSPNDTVVIRAYNAAGALVDEERINVLQEPRKETTITPDAFTLKIDSYVKGKFTGDVKYVALKVGDKTYSKIGVMDDSNWRYYAKDKILSTDDQVTIIGYGLMGEIIVQNDVEVE
ncbi:MULTISPECIES: immunoglobulin-like domain-containing protein [unclassified Listeria]|uniref:immunoglobulin-like domain-containing protein n=1 Tax=unclassified Listeria TaxID=2642072 RepID=UPI0013565FAA|nr:MULTISPECIES: immunoglobulin-like domain-containing protein [unclassified Listeria]